jgi:phosphatidylinositol glycan class T
MCWKFSLFFAIAISLALGASVEEFDETLTIRPLRDGKVASRFSFKTLLKGATPRNPETLNKDDACALKNSPFPT